MINGLFSPGRYFSVTTTYENSINAGPKKKYILESEKHYE